MDPITLAILASATSLVSAVVTSFVKQRDERHGKISVSIGGKAIDITSADRKQLQEAVRKLDASQAEQPPARPGAVA